MKKKSLSQILRCDKLFLSYLLRLLLRLAVLLTRRTDLKASFDSTEEMRRGCAIVKEYIDEMEREGFDYPSEIKEWYNEQLEDDCK